MNSHASNDQRVDTHEHAAYASALRHADEEHVSTIKMNKVRYRVYWCVLAILACVLLYMFGVVLGVLAVPVGIIAWTTIIVFCLKGPVNFMERKGLKRGLATAISYIGLFALLAGVFALMVSPVFGMNEQFSNLITNASSYVATLRDWTNEVYNHYAYLLQDKTINDWMNNAFNSIGSWLSQMAGSSAQGVVAIGSGVGSALMVIGFALVVAYWTLLELPALGRETKRLFGPRYADDLNVWYVVGTDVMGGYIKGTLIQCALIGVLCGVGFAFLGIPSAAALGVITGLLNIIPVVGPWLGGILAAIVGVFVSPWIGLIALVITIIIQQVIYTFVSPKVMGAQVNIHPALVILALMVGSAVGYAMSGFMGSFVGALFSVPIVAAAKSIFVYYFEKKTGRTIVSEDGVIFQGDPVNPKVAHPMQDATGEMSVIKAKTGAFPKVTEDTLPKMEGAHHAHGHATAGKAHHAGHDASANASEPHGRDRS